MNKFATKAEWIADALRRQILSGELKPGDRLLQDEIAEQFDVSSTPAREALQLLAAEGLVDTPPHRGAQVARPETRNIDDLRELYQIRGALEGLAAKLALKKLDSDDIHRLQSLLDEMDGARNEREFERLQELNYEFHFSLYEAAQSPLLYKLIRGLWARFPWDTVLALEDRAQRSATEHLNVTEAITLGDPDIVEQAMRRHIEKGGEATVEYFSNFSLTVTNGTSSG